MEEFMKAAIEEARAGLAEGGIPIGSVLVLDNKIIGRGRNRHVQNNDPLAHSDIECIRNAGILKSYSKTTMFTTLMPCHYCSGAIVQFGIENLVVGESRNFQGDLEFLKVHWVSVDDWDMEECINLMENFIRNNPSLWNDDMGRL
jgi:cytosine/creatinine deaminase